MATRPFNVRDADGQFSQRDADVVTLTAFSGLRNDIQPERFGLSDLAFAENCNLDKSGQLSRRDGFTLQSAGAAHSLWADETQTLGFFVRSGHLYQLRPDYTSIALCALQSDERGSYAKVNDNVYFSNGTDSKVIHNGQARSWGLIPPALPAVTVIGGQMTAGTYQYTLTGIRVDGQESGAQAAGVIEVPASGGLYFELPAGIDPEIAALRLYLSTANGEVLYWAFDTPADAGSMQYTGDTLELTTPIENWTVMDAPAGQLVAYYKGRMFVASGNLLYASEPLAFEQFDPRKFVQLDAPITLLAPMEDKSMQGSGFFVGTERSCGIIIGSGPEDFQYVPKTSYGAVLGALERVDGSVFGDNSLGARSLPIWLTTQGVCVGKPDLQIQNLTRTKFGFPTGGQGAAIFMPGPNRLIMTTNF